MIATLSENLICQSNRDRSLPTQCRRIESRRDLVSGGERSFHMADKISDDFGADPYLPVGKMFQQNRTQQRIVRLVDSDGWHGSEPRAEIRKGYTPISRRLPGGQQQVAGKFHTRVDQMEQNCFRGIVGIIDSHIGAASTDHVFDMGVAE